MSLLLLFLAVQAHAGAWTRSLGEYYAKLGADLYLADEYVVPGGGAAATEGYVGQQYGVYVEAGVAKAHPVQVALSAPLTIGSVAFERVDAFQTATGKVVSVRMGDLRVRPQVALHPDAPIALAVEVKVPLYQLDGICADQGPYADLCPRPGEGQVDITEWLLAGASLQAGEVPVWVELGAGYQHRTEWFIGWSGDEQLSDGLVWMANAGANLGALLLMVKSDATHPLRSDELTPGAVRVGPAAAYTFGEHVAIEARASWDVFARAPSRGMGFGLGVSVRR